MRKEARKLLLKADENGDRQLSLSEFTELYNELNGGDDGDDDNDDNDDNEPVTEAKKLFMKYAKDDNLSKKEI